VHGKGKKKEETFHILRILPKGILSFVLKESSSWQGATSPAPPETTEQTKGVQAGAPPGDTIAERNSEEAERGCKLTYNSIWGR